MEKLKPLPHQLVAADLLSKTTFGGLLDDPGAGKTLSAVKAAAKVMNPHTDYGIVVCPPIVLETWERNFTHQLSEIWTPQVQILRTLKTPLDMETDIFVMSYAIATKRAHEFRGQPIAFLILDEGHAVCKIDPDGSTSKRTRELIGRQGLCNHAKHTWIVTGTLMTKWATDVYPYLMRANKEGLREKCGDVTLDRFLLRYCVTQVREFKGRTRMVRKRLVVGSRNAEELRELLLGSNPRTAVRRRLKDVVAGLPPLVINQPMMIDLERTDQLKALQKLYKGMSTAQVLIALQKDEVALGTLRRALGAAKVKGAAEIILDRVERDLVPLLVGAWHHDVVDGLMKELEIAGIPCARLTGKTTAAAKQALIKRFNDQDLTVLVGQIAAMGVGIDLFEASHRILVVEEDFSPEIMKQFYARLHRWGQKHPVQVESVAGRDKLDEAIRRISFAKARYAAKALSPEEITT